MNDNMNNMVQYFVITTRKVVLLNPTKAGIVVPGGRFPLVVPTFPPSSYSSVIPHYLPIHVKKTLACLFGKQWIY